MKALKVFLPAVIILSLSLCTASVSGAQSLAWPDSSGPKSAACYRIATQPLQISPPLHTDMGWQTLLGYVWLDSLMRHPLTDSAWTILESTRGVDSVRQVLRYLHAAIDYDPVLFFEYCMHGQYLSPYWGRPQSIVSALDEISANALNPDTAHILSLAGTSFILDIIVESSTRSADPKYGGLLGDVCVQALVVDTIKGKRIPLVPCDSIGFSTSRGGKSEHNLFAQALCLKLSYNPLWSKTGEDNGGYGVKNDSVNFSAGCMGFNALEPGREYIVFLRTTYLDYDGTRSYFALSPIMDGEGGVYAVTNSTVSDPLNKWGLGTQVPVAQFKASLRNRLQSILNP